MVLARGLYTGPSNMWRKKLSSETTWAYFKKFFTEEYHGLRKLQCINATQAVFHGANMTITTQYNISKALDNLDMDTN